MPHRLPSLALLGLLLATLALAAPARAQLDKPFAVPADAPTVATTPSGASVLVWVHGGSTCSALQKAGAPRPTRAARVYDLPGEEDVAPGGCPATPVPSRFGGAGLGSVNLDDRHTVSWGYVGLGTAAVQVKASGRLVASAAGSPAGLLPAPAADLRFWAMDDDRSAAIDEIALLDDAGVVRRAIAPDRFGLGADDEFSKGGPEPTGTILRRGRVPRATWELRRTVTRVLAPTPLEPERSVRQACVTFVVRETRTRSTEWGSAPCDDVLARLPMTANVLSSCAIGARVAVLATAEVRRVVVVAGDGTRRPVALTAFLAGERAGALVLGEGVAVRRVVALGAGGRVLATQEVGQAPVRRKAVPCGIGAGRYAAFHAPPRRLGAGAHTPRVLDHGIELCTAIDRAPTVPDDCAIPPVAPDLALVGATTTADGRYLFGVVPAEVAAARITLADRSTRTLVAVPLPGYSGIYAGVLRAIAGDVPGPNAVARVELLDDRGRVLNREATTGDPTVFAPAVTVLPAAHGAPAVVAASAEAYSGAFTCVALRGSDPDDLHCIAGLIASDPFTGPGTVNVQARCSPRRMLVSAILAHTTDRLTVRTASGRTISARMVPFPAGAGKAARGQFLALAVLGPRDAPVEARVRGRAAGRVPIDLPPVGRQCGYSAAPGLVVGLGPLSR